METNLKNGQDLDQATASFTSDEYFEHWYQETKMQLQTKDDSNCQPVTNQQFQECFY